MPRTVGCDFPLSNSSHAAELRVSTLLGSSPRQLRRQTATKARSITKAGRENQQKWSIFVLAQNRQSAEMRLASVLFGGLN